jgi:hypothetical protein
VVVERVVVGEEDRMEEAPRGIVAVAAAVGGDEVEDPGEHSEEEIPAPPRCRAREGKGGFSGEVEGEHESSLLMSLLSSRDTPPEFSPGASWGGVRMSMGCDPACCCCCCVEAEEE